MARETRTVLARICAAKREHIKRRKSAKPLAVLEREARAAGPVRGFAAALEAAVSAHGAGLIAEIKKASPSEGLIRSDFDPVRLARAYAEGGAACLSVLTDTEFFRGADAHLVEARSAVDLPVLRKDFLLDPYQVVEARALGADCVLVILAAVDDAEAEALADAARNKGMDLVFEVHDAQELKRAARLGAMLIGINNRNLKTLSVDLTVCERLARRVPADTAVVCESGLETPADLARMHGAGVHRFLVGTSLMKQADLAAATAALLAPAARDPAGTARPAAG